MTPLVNFSHLQDLTEKITLEGDPVSIVHVYAKYPAYEWADAKESGEEGIACVDDAARAAIVLLRHYELKKDETSRRRARSLLAFVLKMQADDGRFYNFILAKHAINRHGRTSYKSFGWWAARAVWCLGTACRVLKDKDASVAERCRRGVEAVLPLVDTMLSPYNRMIFKYGLRMPEWLMFTTDASATSELMLGLIEYVRATNDPRARSQIEKIAEGLVMMQDGDWKRYPHGLHRSHDTVWHAWANAQTQALASAACFLGLKELGRSAELEAKSFFGRLLIHGMAKEMDIVKPHGNRREYPQIAYDIRPAALGLVRMYELTDDGIYLKMAGLMASWFFGNNSVGEQMYDPATGRCFDGILDAKRVNRNSGAESTVEALAVMLEVSRYSECRRFLGFKRTDSYKLGSEEVGIFMHKDGSSGVLVLDPDAKTLQFFEGKHAGRFHRRSLSLEPRQAL